MDPFTPLNLLPGQTVLGRQYRLQKPLGKGGFSVVWLAESLGGLERLVALKFLPWEISEDDELVTEMKKEMRTTLRLTHHHIVRTHRLAVEKPLAAIEMEYMDAGNLHEYRKSQPGGCLQPQSLQTWIKQICDALVYAHLTVGTVHRDLKPHNLFLKSGPAGEMGPRATPELKIGDFGIATSLTTTLSHLSTQRVTPGRNAGTPVYMSPQQLAGGPTELSDDIYSLGVTLFELLAGSRPFTATQSRSVVPISITEFRQEVSAETGVTLEPVPPAWEETILACLKEDKQARPKTSELAERFWPQPAVPKRSEPAQELVPNRADAAPKSPPAQIGAHISVGGNVGTLDASIHHLGGDR
jgi:serine/threonine protein kinase